MAAKRVILDTNLLISFLISHKLDSIDDLLLNGKITLLFSNELIEEFITVASRPKFKKYFSSVYFFIFYGSDGIINALIDFKGVNELKVRHENDHSGW
jgi:putative PIN family toxin of toxin-antitoxin system